MRGPWEEVSDTWMSNHASQSLLCGRVSPVPPSLSALPGCAMRHRQLAVSLAGAGLLLPTSSVTDWTSWALLLLGHKLPVTGVLHLSTQTKFPPWLQHSIGSDS